MNHSHNILILDDEQGFRDEIGEYLTDKGYHIYLAGLPSQANEIMDSNPIDVAVFDIRLPEMDGLTLLEKIKQKHPGIDVIMMTGFGEMDDVVKAMRFGALDFLKKPFKLNELKEIIERLLKFKTVKRSLDEYDSIHPDIMSGEISLVRESHAMKNIHKLISKIAATPDTTVLISGESGTGKELLARAIHYLSPQKTIRLCLSIVPPSRKNCLRMNFSATAKDPIPMPNRTRKDYLKLLIKGLCSWTKSAT